MTYVALVLGAPVTVAIAVAVALRSWTAKRHGGQMVMLLALGVVLIVLLGAVGNVYSESSASLRSLAAQAPVNSPGTDA